MPLVLALNYTVTFWLQGVLLSVPEAMEDLLAMKRLWVHEVLRVYYDRLVDDNDREWIFDTLHTVVEKNLEEDLDQMFAHLVKGKPPGSRVTIEGLNMLILVKPIINDCKFLYFCCVFLLGDGYLCTRL